MTPTDFTAPVTDRYFEDYVPGTVCIYGDILVTEADIVGFAGRYDPQLIHVNPEAAARGPFGGLIASGWHTTACVMRVLVERYLPTVAAIASPGIDELRWPAPVRPGDILRVRVTIKEASPSRTKPDRGLVRTLVEAVNQDDAVVLSMTAMNLFRRRTPGAASDPPNPS